ncbi:MAG: peptidylprolyl isomerase [Lachnospiraceae bacterium]|nr:peptidylprolyl isomerase [Lachnospiraceae bacterium]
MSDRNDFMRRFLALFLVTLVLLALTACRQGTSTVSDTNESVGYSDGQVMLVVATERNRYRDVYTDQIWGVEVDNAGTTFQTYLLKEIQSFLRELKLMNLLADQQGIRLTGQERDRLERLTDEFYDSLTEADLRYTGVKKEEVFELYSEYHRANRLVDELTSGVNLEISDSEAKVIRVQEIFLTDSDYAENVHTQAMTDGTDFAFLARSVSENKEIERNVSRGEQSKEYEDVVFSLEAGEISPVIREGNNCYIVKCINDYDVEATADRKQRLLTMRKNQAFRQIYDEFVAETPVTFTNEIWGRISLKDENASTTTDFFEKYQEAMNQ